MEKLTELIKSLGMAKLAAFAGVMISVLGFLFYFANWASVPTMTLLYNHLETTEAARVYDKLKTSGILVELRGDGTQIFVPEEKVAELRMQMALDGTVYGGSIGYELFDRTDVLGSSTAMLNINHLRALEGELSKSIKSISEVQSARVHLVIPKKELFSKDKTPPSASVVLKMKGAQRLTSNQIQAVQALISSAVPNLTNDRISIIDDKGTLLARGKDNTATADGLVNQLAIREEYEEKLARQVEVLVEKSVGVDRVRAEVAVEMDFDRVTTQAVEYNPDGQVARSINTAEEGLKSNASTANNDSVSIQNALPNQQQGQSNNSDQQQSNKTEENTSYEISNKTTTTVKETGVIKRLSVAVLVDGTYQADANGKATYTARPAEEITQLTELVQTAVGYKADRGDTIKVINLKFAPAEEVKPVEITLLQGILNSLDYRKIIEISIVGLFALIVLFTFIRPTMKKLMNITPPKMVETRSRDYTRMPSHVQDTVVLSNGQSSSPAYSSSQRGAPGSNDNGSSSLSETIQKIMHESDDEEGDLNFEKVEGLVKSSSVKKMSSLIKSHPDETIALLRSWLYEESST